MEIVKVDIIDNDLSYNENPILDTYYLIDPDREKLQQLKEMIENRFEYQYDETLSDEEIIVKELIVDNIWDCIYDFITTNFKILDINEVFEIKY